MLGNILSVIYLIAYIISGISISNFFLHNEKTTVRIWLGCVIGLILLVWVPALLSFCIGFTKQSQYIALVFTCIICIVFYILSNNRTLNKSSFLEETNLVFLFLPIFLIGLVLFCNHTIFIRDGALYVGQSTYGDLSMHLGFITSISEQKVFPPFYSICPEVPVGYPFLSDSISSTFYTLGADLRFATLLPALYAYALVIAGVYMFMKTIVQNDNGKTVFGTLLFFFGGGFGFAYFFDMLKENPHNFSRIFSAFYETPTNYVSSGIKWVNPIADMLVPQRATLFGWALLFASLYLLLRVYMYKEHRFVYLLGAIAGAMPLIHTHSFLALGVISAVYLIICIIRQDKRSLIPYFIIYAFISVMLALPQLVFFTFRQSGSFLCLHFNWANSTDNPIWFYVKNLGLLFVLLPVALLHTSKKMRSVLWGPFILWLLAECIQFQPNTYDNNKLLFVCFAFLCALISDYLVDICRKLVSIENKKAFSAKCLALLVCISLFLSGTLTLIREYLSEYQLFSRNEVIASEYIKENTKADSIFLTHNNHNNVVATLTGRNIVCGSGSYLYFHGINYFEREANLKNLYENPSKYLDELEEKYKIDYIYVSGQELYNYDCDLEYFSNHFRKIYSSEDIMIFDLHQTL